MYLMCTLNVPDMYLICTVRYSTQKVGCVGVCWGVLQQKHIPPGNLWGVAGTPQWYTPDSGV